MCPKTNKPKPKITRSMRLGLGAHSHARKYCFAWGLKVLLRMFWVAGVTRRRPLRGFAPRPAAVADADALRGSVRGCFASTAGGFLRLRRTPPPLRVGSSGPSAAAGWSGWQPITGIVRRVGGGRGELLRPPAGPAGGGPLIPRSPSPRWHHFAELCGGLGGGPGCVY